MSITHADLKVYAAEVEKLSSTLSRLGSIKSNDGDIKKGCDSLSFVTKAFQKVSAPQPAAQVGQLSGRGFIDIVQHSDDSAPPNAPKQR